MQRCKAPHDQHISRFTRTSHVTRHTSHLTPHTSHAVSLDHPFSQAAFTSRVLAIDADFVPNVNASVLLQALPRARDGTAKAVYIVPIFTENGDHILPCVFVLFNN
jgi:hypothetical protein